MMSEKLNSKYNGTIFFVFLYFFSFVVAKLVGSNIGLMISICWSISIILSYCYESKIIDIKKHHVLFLLAIVLLSIVSIYMANYKVSRLAYNALLFLTSWVVAVFIFRTPFLIKKILIMLQRLFLLFCLVALVFSFINGVAFHVYIERFSVGFSYNYISGYLILIFTLYCSYFARLKIKIPYGRIHAIAVFVLCVFLYGRSGIFLSALLLISVYFYNASRVERLLYLIFGLISFFLLLIFHEFFLQLLSQTKFSEGVSSPRFAMFIEYLSLLSAKTLFFGVDLLDMITIAPYDYNPHNSFLYFHATFGVFSLFLLFVLFVRVIGINNIWFIVFLSFYCLRGFFDVIIFPGILDFVFFSLILMTPFNFKVHKYSKRLT